MSRPKSTNLGFINGPIWALENQPKPKIWRPAIHLKFNQARATRFWYIGKDRQSRLHKNRVLIVFNSSNWFVILEMSQPASLAILYYLKLEKSLFKKEKRN